jgi:hypothetical protein
MKLADRKRIQRLIRDELNRYPMNSPERDDAIYWIASTLKGFETGREEWWLMLGGNREKRKPAK